MSKTVMQAGSDASTLVRQTRRAARYLAGMSGDARIELRRAAADAIESRTADIVAANEEDCIALAPDVASGAVSQALADRLQTSSAGVREMAARIRDVASLEDPLAHVIATTELDDSLTLYKVPSPLLVIPALFDSPPHLVPQFTSLSIK